MHARTQICCRCASEMSNAVDDYKKHLRKRISFIKKNPKRHWWLHQCHFNKITETFCQEYNHHLYPQAPQNISQGPFQWYIRHFIVNSQKVLKDRDRYLEFSNISSAAACFNAIWSYSYPISLEGSRRGEMLRPHIETATVTYSIVSLGAWCQIISYSVVLLKKYPTEKR